MGSQRVRYNVATQQQKSIIICDLILPHYTSGKNKIGVFPNYISHEVVGPDAMIFIF